MKHPHPQSPRLGFQCEQHIPFCHYTISTVTKGLQNALKLLHLFITLFYRLCRNISQYKILLT